MSFKQVIITALASTALAQMTTMETQMDGATTTPAMSPSDPQSYPGVIVTSLATMATESGSVTSVPAEVDSSVTSAAGYVTETTSVPAESSAAGTTSMPMESSMSSTTPTSMDSSMSGSATTMTTMAGGTMGGGMGGQGPNATASTQPVAGSGVMTSFSAGLFIVSATFTALLLL